MTDALVGFSRTAAKMPYAAGQGASPIRSILQVLTEYPIGSTVPINGENVEVVQCQPWTYGACSAARHHFSPLRTLRSRWIYDETHHLSSSLISPAAR